MTLFWWSKARQRGIFIILQVYVIEAIYGLFSYSLVNSFTLFNQGGPISPQYTLFSRKLVKKLPRCRAVRRVHVMPWATPVRRIGCTLAGFVFNDDIPAPIRG
jgi:hypothetical protein